MIFASPWQRQKGGKSKSPVEFVDIFPTLCELCGLDIPEVLQGKSLVPQLDDPEASVRKAALHQYPRSNSGSMMGYTLRSERYRYIKWLQIDYYAGERTGPLVGRELYDYEKDPGETTNFAGNPDYANVIDEFEAMFKDRGVAQHTSRRKEHFGFPDSKIAPPPPSGEVLIKNLGTPEFNGKEEFVDHRLVKIGEGGIDLADEVEVSGKPPKSSRAAYKRRITMKIPAGKKVVCSFLVRCLEGEPAEFNAALQPAAPPFKQFAGETVSAGKEWKKVTLPGSAPEDIAPNSAVLTLHLGFKPQTIQLANLEIDFL